MGAVGAVPSRHRIIEIGNIDEYAATDARGLDSAPRDHARDRSLGDVKALGCLRERHPWRVAAVIAGREDRFDAFVDKSLDCHCNGPGG
jgi:hypothetical protein